MSDRYARQIALQEIGDAGQARLAQTSALVVGAGGLGCAVLQYLCAAGIGHLTVVDHDRVEVSNLHRQPLYRMSDVGSLKATAAHDALLDANPQARVDAVCEAVTPANASRLVAAADIVVDAADSFAVTYSLSDACQDAGKALVSASVLGLSGYVGVFCGGGPSYRAVFPAMPQQAGTCAQTGVLGTAVGVIGTLQAQMALSMVLQLEPSVLSQLVSVDFHGMRFGGFRFGSAQEPPATMGPRFISPEQLHANDVVVDVRSLDEIAAAPFASTVRVSVSEFANVELVLRRAQRVVICCRTGMRAWRAAGQLQAQGYENIVLIALG